MHINFNLLHKKGLEPQDIYFLAGIRQIEKEVLDNLPGDVFNRLEALSLLTSIKGKKGDNPMYNVRLSSVGKKLVKEVFTEPTGGEDEDEIYLSVYSFSAQKYSLWERIKILFGGKTKTTDIILTKKNFDKLKKIT